MRHARVMPEKHISLQEHAGQQPDRKPAQDDRCPGHAKEQPIDHLFVRGALDQQRLEAPQSFEYLEENLRLHTLMSAAASRMDDRERAAARDSTSAEMRACVRLERFGDPLCDRRLFGSCADDLGIPLALMDARQRRSEGRLHDGRRCARTLQCSRQRSGVIAGPGDSQVAPAEPVSQQRIARRHSTEQRHAPGRLNGERSVDEATFSK